MNTLNNTLEEGPKMYETENDISLKRRSELNALMNQRLADAVDLQMQLKQAHWNVKGPSFISLHAVSYTHLDVYKRQDLYRVLRFWECSPAAVEPVVVMQDDYVYYPSYGVY